MGGHRYTNSIPQSTTEYSGLQIQSTSTCLPVPLLWGRTMISPNCVWYNNFQKHPQGAKGGHKGGGGSSSSGKNQNTYTYTAAVIMALCEGPISGIGEILNGSPPSFPISDINASYCLGADPQGVWSYLVSAYPSEALSYNGVAYIYSEQFDLGSGATIGSYTFEVYGVHAGSGFNGIDADPALVIYDFLTNPRYGVGFPASSIDMSLLIGGSGTSSYQAYCWAAGFAISPYMSNREQASSALARWLQITNSTAVWTSGVLKIIPFCDSDVSGSECTWFASTAPLYDLTDEDFVYSAGEDPVQITRADPYSTPNWQCVEILSRDDYYNSGPIIAQDQSYIDRYGLRTGSTVTAHEICENAIGQTSVQLILQRALYIRNTYKFKLSFEFCLLDPMDLVTLTDPYLGLNQLAVRITAVDEDQDGILTVTAEEFPSEAATATVYPVQTRSTGYPDYSSAAPPVYDPHIFEPPPLLSNNTPQVWAGVTGPNIATEWGGCFVWASLDNISYGNVGKLLGSSTTGYTTNSLPIYGGTNPDTLHTLSVDLTESSGALISTTAANAAGGATCAYIGGEYISFTTATLTGLNTYDLTGLYRGQFGVSPMTIPSGSSFVLLTGNLFEYTLPLADVGDTLYLKFQSFNIMGGGIQDLAACSVYVYSAAGLGVIGPVTSTLLLGMPMDYGLASALVSEKDDWGDCSSSVTATIDLGNVTS